MVCGLALLASGQVIAATYYSIVAGGAWGTAATWNAVSCGGAETATGAVPTAADTVFICGGTVTSGTGTF